MLDDFGSRAGHQEGGELAVDLLGHVEAESGGGVARIVGHIGQFEGDAEVDPLGLGRGGDADPAVADLHERDGVMGLGVAVVGAVLDASLVGPHDEAPLVGGGHRFHRADIDQLAASGRAAGVERGHRADGCGDSGDVGRPRACALQRFAQGVAGDVEVAAGGPVGEVG